jgi:arylsulfatase A-like enzyme
MRGSLSFILLFLLLGSLGLTSCERGRKPSILIVAVDSLPFNLSVCSPDNSNERSGFRVICEESIRFTHAMTPSVLSVPALASILTGMNPVQHGVRHNGAPGLSPGSRTFAESALQKGYRTAFFSGGAPVWRRSGLHQGFEIFDDTLNFSNGRLFRSFSENRQIFQSWLNQEVSEKSFAAVLYAPDLSFTDTVTETAAGEWRNLSYDSQLEELDESLESLFTFLKRSNRWNDTLVILAGLNGREISPRDHDIEPIILNSENTQVTLFVKPAAKPRDQALRWTIDRNVSLSDLGKTLFEIVDDPRPKSTVRRNFPVVSLMAGLKSAQPDWDEERSILIESGWPLWHGYGGVRAAVLRGHELTFFNDRPVSYNTLTDRFETTPLPLTTADAPLVDALKKNGFSPWEPLPEKARAVFRFPSLNWLTAARSPALHRELSILAKQESPDSRVLRWAAQSALEQRDWNLLLAAGKKAGRANWIAVAERNLGKKTSFKDSCLLLLAKAAVNNNELKSCNDELFLSLFAWVRADLDREGREVLRRRFLKSWETAQQDLRILKSNVGLGLLWLPDTKTAEVPSLTSLALALPELRRFSY